MFRFLCVAVLTTLLAAAGCENSSGPSMDGVAGNYAAVTFASTTGGVTTNHLAQGASIQLSLLANGTTTGQMLVPGGDENGGDLVANLAGSWTLSGNTVNLDQAADTFLRDMPFGVVGTTMVGDATFSGTRIRVTFVRQ
jgi:hypothetical protein